MEIFYSLMFWIGVIVVGTTKSSPKMLLHTTRR